VTPGAPTTPTTPASPASSTPSTPTRPRDIYNRAPRELKPARPLNGGVDLGTIGGAHITVGRDGTLGFGGVTPTSLSEQIRAVKVAVTQAPDNQPLAGVTDVAVLRSVAVSAAKLHDSLLRAPRNDAEALEFRSGRAAALALLEAAARQAGAAGDTEARDALTLGLMFSIQKEPYRPLKDFAFESSLTRAEKGELAKTRTAEAHLYPPRPPYEKWMRDGKISVMHYTDNDGSPRADNVQFWKDRGFRAKDNPDGSTTLTRRGRNGEPPMEVTIPPAPSHDAPPSLFEKMGDDSVDIIIYAGHAGYGRRVEDALSKGVSGTGDGKLVMLLQCYGEGSIESVKRSFPDAHLFSTREASDDNYDFTLLWNMMNGIERQQGYAAIEKANNKEFNEWVASLTPSPDGLSESDIKWYKDHPVETHYFYPSQREVFLNKLDRDRDGVIDANDSVFNVVYPKRIDATGGYEPLDPGAPLDGLEGTAVNNAVNQLNLFARYTELPAGLIGNGVPWNPDVFVSTGFHEASSTDLRAFRFDIDQASGRISVSTNAAFAHAPAEALARMLAIEAGQFVGARAGLAADQTAALSLSFLERIIHQGGSGSSWNATAIESKEVKEKLLTARYGMALTPSALMAASGDPDDFTAQTYETILAKVRSTPGLEALATTEPRRATEALTVPADMQLSGSLDRAALQSVLDRLGVAGTVDADAHRWSTRASPGSRLVISVRDAQNALSYVSLGIDSEGTVRAGARITP
jgi:hypothetical protein